MTRSANSPMRMLGAVLVAIPFAFAGMRWLTSGSDTRYVWMAAASALCAAAVLVRPRSPAVPNRGSIGIAVIAAAVCAAAVGVGLGARAITGIAIVAVAFGVCSAVGAGLVVRSTKQEARLGGEPHA